MNLPDSCVQAGTKLNAYIGSVYYLIFEVKQLSKN